MTDQPEALRVAMQLNLRPDHSLRLDAARLLREQPAEIERLRAEIETLRADAERYRRLKRAFTVTLLDGSVRFGTNYIRAKSIAEIDAAVDAAVKGEKP